MSAKKKRHQASCFEYTLGWDVVSTGTTISAYDYNIGTGGTYHYFSERDYREYLKLKEKEAVYASTYMCDLRELRLRVDGFKLC